MANNWKPAAEVKRLKKEALNTIIKSGNELKGVIFRDGFVSSHGIWSVAETFVKALKTYEELTKK